jgi:hypothetical protein
VRSGTLRCARESERVRTANARPREAAGRIIRGRRKSSRRRRAGRSGGPIRHGTKSDAAERARRGQSVLPAVQDGLADFGAHAAREPRRREGKDFPATARRVRVLRSAGHLARLTSRAQCRDRRDAGRADAEWPAAISIRSQPPPWRVNGHSPRLPANPAFAAAAAANSEAAR